MKLKKWGALLLALCMIVMVFPTTAMADENTLSGRDAEKKVIENDLIVQAGSADKLIGQSPTPGDLPPVISDPEWERYDKRFRLSYFFIPQKNGSTTRNSGEVVLIRGSESVFSSRTAPTSPNPLYVFEEFRLVGVVS